MLRLWGHQACALLDHDPVAGYPGWCLELVGTVARHLFARKAKSAHKGESREKPPQKPSRVAFVKGRGLHSFKSLREVEATGGQHP